MKENFQPLCLSMHPPFGCVASTEVAPSVQRLSALDLSKVLATVDELYQLDVHQGFVPLAHQVLRELVRLVPRAELGNLGHIDFRTRQGTFVTPWGFVMPAGRRAHVSEFLHEHPVLMHYEQTGDGSPWQLTDFMSRRQFENTGLFHECYRGYVRGMILFALPSPPLTLLDISLSSTHVDFLERDRAVLALVRPHVARVFDRCMEIAAWRAGSPAMGGGGVAVPSVIQASPDGDVYYRTRAAAVVLERHFPGVGAHQLPSPVRAWVQEPPQPLGDRPARRQRIFQSPDGSAIAIDARWADQSWSLSLSEPHALDECLHLRELGLTGRESQVLAWMARCKTNAEIAVILELSPRTVEKHVESILRKLQVEHRTAAIMRALGADGDAESPRAP